MALKRLKWLKYLFVNRTEAETEQNYWNEKRKRHIANEHKEGVVVGLGVTEANPPSLSIVIQGGRAIDTNGNDPEVETAQEIDFTSLVPGIGTRTVYLKLTFNEAEVEPYFVDEIGDYQNKYIQDGSVLEAVTDVPLAPSLELARIVLAAGVTEITDAADPLNPGVNEIDLRYRKDSTVFVMALQDLTDVHPDEADAFNNMNNPSAANPIATMDDLSGGVSGIAAEVAAARGSQASLDTRLDVSLNENGSFKGITAIQPAAPLTGGGTSGTVPIGINLATPVAAGAMSAADKAKLDSLEDNHISNVSYDAATWDGNTDGASKNALRDKIVVMDAGILANAVHSTGNGSDHSAVAANTAHRTGDGSDHSKVTGSVTAHSDVSSAGSGQIITTAERSQLHSRSHSLSGSADHSAPAGFAAAMHRSGSLVFDAAGLPVPYAGSNFNNRERQFMLNAGRYIAADGAFHSFGTTGDEFRIRLAGGVDYMFHMRVHWYANPSGTSRGLLLRFKFPNVDTYPRKFWAGGWQRQEIGLSSYANSHQYRLSVVNINGTSYVVPGVTDEALTPHAGTGYMIRENSTTSSQESFAWSGTYSGIDQGYLDVIGLICSQDEGWFYPEIRTSNYQNNLFLMQGSFLRLLAGQSEALTDLP